MATLPSLSRQDYADLLSTFLSDIKFTMPQSNPDLTIDQRVIAYFETQPWSPSLIQTSMRKAAMSAEIIRLVYPYVDRDTTIAYGIFCTYMYLIDDSEEALDTEMAITSFGASLFQEKRQQSPFLQSMLSFLNDLGIAHFGPFSRTMINKSMIEFISGRLLETHYSSMHPPSGALKFPYYFRQKTSMSEPFAHFMFPDALYPEHKCLERYILVMPDVCDIISFINDIFSFYKESILAREVNYLSNVAVTQGIDVSESLRHTAQEAVQSVRNIRQVLAECPAMRETTIRSVWGYIAAHMSQARYRLGELDLRVPSGSVGGCVLDQNAREGRAVAV